MIGWILFIALCAWILWRHKREAPARAAEARRCEFLRGMIERADRTPGGKEFIRCPYNEFVQGVWMEEASRNYPRKEFRPAVGVVESR